MTRVVFLGDHRGTIWLDPRGWLDPGGERRRAREALLEKVASLRPDLVVDTGDLVAAGDPQHWRRCDEELAPIRAAGIAMDAVLGNHELYGWIPIPRPDARRLAEFERRFPRAGGLRWGSRDAGPARILLLDSNERALSAEERAAQESWLSAAVEAAESDPAVSLLLAAWHHPPFTNTTKYGDDRFSARSFLPRLRGARKLGAVFCGHVHGYERFWADSISWVVTGGGGAPAHRFPRDPARWRHTPAFDASALPFLHFVEIEIEGAAGRAVVHHFDARRWVEGDRFEIRPRQR